MDSRENWSCVWPWSYSIEEDLLQKDRSDFWSEIDFLIGQQLETRKNWKNISPEDRIFLNVDDLKDGKKNELVTLYKC